MKRQIVLAVFLTLALFGNSGWLSAQDHPADLTHPFLQVDIEFSDTPSGVPELAEFAADHFEIARLGQRLFFDPILSLDGSKSCATCHLPEHGFSTPVTIAEGVGGKLGRRHPPALINRHLGTSQFWDGRIQTLEAQSLEPIENENELASSVDAVLEKLQNDEHYKTRFSAIFKDGVTRDNLATAIAGFERTLVNGDSPIDRFVTAQVSELSRSQRQGLWLYESKGGCWQCHSGQNYSDEKFHNTGVSWGVEPLDLGRFEHTADASHKGQFKTPTLRNVAATAPYMHDGSIKTLREVVEFYNRGGGDNPGLDRRLKPLKLTEQEIDDLVAFMEGLSGRYAWEPRAPFSDAETPADEMSKGEE